MGTETRVSTTVNMREIVRAAPSQIAVEDMPSGVVLREEKM
jgi:hypothetical protein